MLTITNVATLRNVEAVPDKFNVAGIYRLYSTVWLQRRRAVVTACNQLKDRFYVIVRVNSSWHMSVPCICLM